MPGDETRSREESEMRRLSKEVGWSVTTLPENATSTDYAAFKEFVREMVNGSKYFEGVRTAFNKIEAHSKWKEVVLKEDFDAMMANDPNSTKKNFCSAHDVLRKQGQGSATAPTLTPAQMRGKIAQEKFRILNLEREEHNLEVQGGMLRLEPEEQGASPVQVSNGTGRPITGEARASATRSEVMGRERMASEEKEAVSFNMTSRSILTHDLQGQETPTGSGTISMARRRIQLGEQDDRSLNSTRSSLAPSSISMGQMGQRMQEQVQVQQNTPIASMRRDREESQRRLRLLESSSPHGGHAPVVNARRVTETQDGDAYEQLQCVHNYYTYADAVNNKLGPIIRQLVPSTLLSLKFSEVYQEIQISGNIFNACLFLRMGQDMFLRSTAVKEIREMGKACREAESCASQNMATISDQVRKPLLIATKIARAGPGSEVASELFYRRMHMELILVALDKQSTHNELFGQMPFLNVLEQLRAANWSAEAWATLITYVKAYEQARNIDSNEEISLYRSGVAFSATTTEVVQGKNSGEVMPQIGDLKEEISTWTLEEMNGKCFTCGEQRPCKHNQEDGMCAGKGTVIGRANTKAAFEHKKNLEAKQGSPQIEEKQNTKAMTVFNARSDQADSNTSSDDEEYTLLDSIPVHTGGGTGRTAAYRLTTRRTTQRPQVKGRGKAKAKEETTAKAVEGDHNEVQGDPSARAKANINTKAIESDQEEVQRDPSVKANINAKVVKEDQEEVQDPSAKEDQDDPEAVKAKRYVRHVHTELVCDTKSHH